MPTSYLLDTSALTALAGRHPVALERLRGLDPTDELHTCFIVVGEWEYGIRNAPGARRQAQIRASGEPILAALTGVWHSSPTIAVRYGTLCAQIRAAGQMIPTNDLWIAAIAEEYDAVIVSADPHFRRVPGLRVVDWTRP